MTSFVTVAVLAAQVATFGAEKNAEKKVKPYPLDVCAVSGEKFGGEMGDPFVFAFEGREVKLCCKDCKGEFEKNTSKFVAKIDQAAKKVKPYPLKTCIISDEELSGDHGEVGIFIHAGREIKICCADCKKDFDKEPAKFLSKLDKEAKELKL